MIYKASLLAGPMIWRTRQDEKLSWNSVWPIKEPLPSKKTWLYAFLSAVILSGSAIFTIYFFHEMLGIDKGRLKDGMDTRFSLTTPIAVGLVLYLFTFNAALEELHFRAWLDVELSTRYGNWVGVFVSSNLFAAMHMFIFAGMDGVSVLSMSLVYLSLVIAGVTWSMFRRVPGGIHAAWLSHGLTDAVLLSWGLFWLGYFN
ncbi:MAG: CPBP family glutamic-type intramembrane protease [Pirellulales bacterium]